MALPFILHSLFLSLAVIFTYIWTADPTLSSYNLQLTAVLILSYFLSRLVIKKNTLARDTASTIILTSVTLLLIFSTGGLRSPLFFLLDFLIFALALLFEPWQASLLSTLLAGLFFLRYFAGISNSDIANLVSLLIMGPIALVLGRKFLESQAAAGKIQILEDQVSKEQTDTLLWISTQAKPTLSALLDTTSLIIGSNSLPYSLHQKVLKLHSDLIALHQSADILEKDIDETTKTQ